MVTMARAEFVLTDEARATLQRVGLAPKKGARPLGVSVDPPRGKRAEAWRAEYSVAQQKSVRVQLSQQAKEAHHPFLALREVYEDATSQPSTVDLTSPAHVRGRADATERQRVLQVLDGLIADPTGGAYAEDRMADDEEAESAAAHELWADNVFGGCVGTHVSC